MLSTKEIGANKMGDGRTKLKVIFWSSIGFIVLITCIYMLFMLSAGYSVALNFNQWMGDRYIHFTAFRVFLLHPLVYFQLPRFCRYINANAAPYVAERARKKYVIMAIFYESLMALTSFYTIGD